MNRRKTDSSFLKQTSKRLTTSFLTPMKSNYDLRKSSKEMSKTPESNDSMKSNNDLMKSNNDLTKSYDSFYKNVFEDKYSNSTGVKELLFQQMADERSQYRMTLTPFLSNSARNFSYFNKSSYFYSFILIILSIQRN